MNAVSDRESLVDEERQQVRARWRRALVMLGLAFSVLIAWGGYRALVAYRITSLDKLCAAASEESRWGDLETLALRWMRWQPDNAAPWLYAADAARGQGDLDHSIEYLRQVPDGKPLSSRALLRLSDLLFHEKASPLEAAEVCRRILDHDPRNVEAHRRLIYIYGMTLQRSKMMMQARKAMDLNCDLPETYLYLLGTDWISFAGAYELNTRWLQKHPDEEVFLVSRALHFAGMSSEDEAAEPRDELLKSRQARQEQMVRDAFERFPQNLELLAYYLRQASKDGDIDRMAELLGQAPPEALEDNRFWRYKGGLHVAKGEHQQAEAAYKKALRLNPFDWRSQHELADVLRRLGRHDQVDRWAKLAMEGRTLWREVMELPDVQSAPISMMRRIAQYARACGDHRFADCLEYRLGTTQ